MEFTSSWGVERVWGNYSYYNTGEPAADKYAFVIDSGISLDTNDLNVNTEWAKSFVTTSSPFDDVMVTVLLLLLSLELKLMSMD